MSGVALTPRGAVFSEAWTTKTGTLGGFFGSGLHGFGVCFWSLAAVLTGAGRIGTNAGGSARWAAVRRATGLRGLETFARDGMRRRFLPFSTIPFLEHPLTSGP